MSGSPAEGVAGSAFAGASSPRSGTLTSRFDLRSGSSRRRGGGGGRARKRGSDKDGTDPPSGPSDVVANGSSSSSATAPLSGGGGPRSIVQRPAASASVEPAVPLGPDGHETEEENKDGRQAGLHEAAATSPGDEKGEDKIHRGRGRRSRLSLPLLLNRTSNAVRSCLESGGCKRAVSMFLALVLCVLLADVALSPPEKRLIRPSTFKLFLTWVQSHPIKGLLAYVLVYGFTVVLLIPGTPLTIGSGYIYKMAYGWGVGVTIGSIFSTLGSLLGSVMCFCLGRYLMKERVRSWVKKYPMFDAIDVAVGENGFKIMALLYLTPILPLGPVSYMCGTTSMKLAHFAAAKIACLPLMIFYVFLGASAGTLVHKGGKRSSGEGGNTSTGAEGATASAVGDELDALVEGESTGMIIFAMVLSVTSVALISHFVKKELFKVLNKQQNEEGTKNYDVALPLNENSSADHLVIPPATDDRDGIEMRRQQQPRHVKKIHVGERKDARQRRPNLGPGAGASRAHPTAEDVGGVDEGSHGKDV